MKHKIACCLIEKRLLLTLPTWLQVLYPDIVLSILLLSAVVLKAPVTPVDLIGQTLSGELPFFKEIYAACNRLDPNGSLRLVNLINRPGMSHKF